MTDTLTLETNYTKFINYCIEIFKPTNEFIIVIIVYPNILKISSLIKKESHFKVTCVYETNEKIDERIFCNFENFEAFLLAEKNNDKSLISENLLKRLKIHEFDSFENATCSKMHAIKFRKDLGNISNQIFAPPLFEYFIRDVCDFEAILYYVLNTIKVFMGEVIEIVFADKTEVKSYTFRRGLFNFVFKRKMKRRNFRADILPLQDNKHVIILKETTISKINEKYTVIKMSPENIKKGLEYYEKAEEEQALAVSGTSDYIEILEELQDKADIKETKKNVNLPVISIQKINPSDKNKKVFIEIKNGAFRIYVTEIKGKKNDLIFAYPENEEFIPMYISFLRKTAIIGKQAIEDYKTHPKSVVFDIVNVLGKLKHNPPKINPKWGFQLLPISDSHEAKLGFKVHTFNGVKLFPVEIIFAILFKYLLNIASKHLHIKSIDIRFLQIKLTPLQRICLKDVGKLLNISVNVESHL